MTVVVLPKALPRDKLIERIGQFLAELPAGKAWQVEITERKRRRSDQQNRYLWGCVYPTILREGVEQLAGWSSEDLHEYMLGEHFGWEVLEGFDKKRLRPIRRSSRLSTLEFAEYTAFIQRKAAELGIYVPDPNEGAPL